MSQEALPLPPDEIRRSMPPLDRRPSDMPFSCGNPKNDMVGLMGKKNYLYKWGTTWDIMRIIIYIYTTGIYDIYICIYTYIYIYIYNMMNMIYIYIMYTLWQLVDKDLTGRHQEVVVRIGRDLTSRPNPGMRGIVDVTISKQTWFICFQVSELL